MSNFFNSNNNRGRGNNWLRNRFSFAKNLSRRGPTCIRIFESIDDWKNNRSIDESTENNNGDDVDEEIDCDEQQQQEDSIIDRLIENFVNRRPPAYFQYFRRPRFRRRWISTWRGGG